MKLPDYSRKDHRLAGVLAQVLFWLSALAGGLFLVVFGMEGGDPAAICFGIGWGLALGLELHARRIF